MRAVGQLQETLACFFPSAYLNSSPGDERNPQAPASVHCKVKLAQASGRKTESNSDPSQGTKPFFHLGMFTASWVLSFLICKREIILSRLV